jgi:succinyl-CoA synthetase alpha subunit
VSIIVNRHTRLIVQGITGRIGAYYTQRMLAAGTQIVAGVTPGKGGESVSGVPVYDTLAEAIGQHPAEASIVYAPPPVAKDAILEAVDANMRVVICIVDGIPVRDMLIVKRRLADSQTILIGPNSPGIITPREFVSGYMPPAAFTPGPVGIVSRSGTLTYQTASLLSRAGIGQSTALGIGGDPVTGVGFVEALARFEADDQTRAVVMIGEIGGVQEELAAEYVRTRMTKPVLAFIGGRTAPQGSRMGHAGAIVDEGRGGYPSKVAALKAAGIPVASLLTEVPELAKRCLS